MWWVDRLFQTTYLPSILFLSRIIESERDVERGGGIRIGTICR